MWSFQSFLHSCLLYHLWYRKVDACCVSWKESVVESTDHWCSSSFLRQNRNSNERDRPSHVPWLAYGAQAWGGDLQEIHPSARGNRSVPSIPTSAPSHDPCSVAERGKSNHRGATDWSEEVRGLSSSGIKEKNYRDIRVKSCSITWASPMLLLCVKSTSP